MCGEKLLTSLIAGSRPSLARAITLVESRKWSVDQRQLLRALHAHHRGLRRRTVRVGISGGPGCGKSTFIETFGNHLIDRYGKRIAVLAVDPSSGIGGGSLLGDKTRMHNLSRNPNAFIRPSPSGGHYGGVTRTTGDAIMLCESAGYEIVLIETVGVGQSEYEVSHLCDLMALLVAPSGGDEIQAIKKGIVEMANLVVVTKSDGELVRHARKMAAEFLSATKFVNVGERPVVKRCSAVTGEGIDEIWLAIEELVSDQSRVWAKRREQRAKTLKMYLTGQLLELLESRVDLRPYEELLRRDDSALVYDVINEIIVKFGASLAK